MPPSLKAKLQSARRRWRSVQAAGGLASWAAAVITLILAAFWADRLFVMHGSGRLASLLTLSIGSVLLAGVFLLLPLLRRLSDDVVAEQVERRYPVLEERLLTTIALARAGATAGVSSAMAAQVARETESLAAPLNFARAIPWTDLRRPAVVLWVAIALLSGHLVLAPEMMQTWARRILNPYADIPLFGRTLLWVTPEDTVVPRGANIGIEVRAGGRLPDTATLHYRFDDGPWNKVALNKPQTVKDGEERLHTFPFKINDAQQSVSYYATAFDGRSNPHTVKVENRPTILGVRLNLAYPAYTHKPAQTLETTSGNIVAPAGTKVEIVASANKPLQVATLMIDGKADRRWEVRGDTARGNLIVQRDLSYGLALKDRHGFDAERVPEYTVRVQEDTPPSVQVTAPAADVERTPTGTVPLRAQASDDYGVQGVTVSFQVAQRQGALPLPGGNGQREVTTGGLWQLAALSLKPGDVVTYRVLARDGNTVTGPGVGKSDAYRVRILSAGEMRDRIDARIADEQEALQRLVERQREAQTQLDQARRSGNAAAFAQAAQTQRTLGEESAELARRMADTSQQMRDNNIGSKDELARRDAARQSLQNIGEKNAPTAAANIERAQQPAARAAASTAAGQQQAIRKELERIARELGKGPDLLDLAREANELARTQQRLAEQARVAAAEIGDKKPSEMTAAERASLNEIANQQSSVRERTEALQGQVQQAAREARERRMPGASDLQRAAQRVNEAAPTEKQTAAERSLKSGAPEQAASPQSAAAEALRELASGLNQAGLAQADPATLQRRAAELRQSAAELQNLAREQSYVNQEARNATRQQQEGRQPDANYMKSMAERENKINERAEQLQQKLGDAPDAQRSVDAAQENVQNAGQQLNQNQPAAAMTPGSRAQRQLEQAAREAQTAARNMEQQYLPTARQREVEQLAAEQRALKQQTAQLEKDRGQLTSRELSQRTQDLAKRQGDLVKRGRDVAKQMPSKAFEWAQDEAVRRMSEAASDLRQKQTGAPTQRQQENAAQTLERIARALQQQAEGARQAAAQQQAEGGEQQADAAMQTGQAAAELQLAREMQAQIRQETVELNQQRDPQKEMTSEQLRELGNLQQAQRQTESIAKSAGEQLFNVPQAQKTVEKAREEMQAVQEQLRQKETGRPTQDRQRDIVQLLDQAVSQAQQQMAQQAQAAQQQSQQQQQAQQQSQQQAENQTGEPQSRAPIVPFQKADPRNATLRGKGFGGLDPRSMKSLREGQNERVPAEYRDLVNQYYKALSQGER